MLWYFELLGRLTEGEGQPLVYGFNFESVLAIKLYLNLRTFHSCLLQSYLLRIHRIRSGLNCASEKHQTSFLISRTDLKAHLYVDGHSAPIYMSDVFFL